MRDAKISQTSLFAELVKVKQTQDKAIKCLAAIKEKAAKDSEDTIDAFNPENKDEKLVTNTDTSNLDNNSLNILPTNLPPEASSTEVNNIPIPCSDMMPAPYHHPMLHPGMYYAPPGILMHQTMMGLMPGHHQIPPLPPGAMMSLPGAPYSLIPTKPPPGIATSSTPTTPTPIKTLVPLPPTNKVIPVTDKRPCTPPLPPPPLPAEKTDPVLKTPKAVIPTTITTTTPTINTKTSNNNSITTNNKSKKITKLTKLPMPPGMKQGDLEMIDSPPSSTPSPEPTKKKTPPRKGIKDLPMPPGKYFINFIHVNSLTPLTWSGFSSERNNCSLILYLWYRVFWNMLLGEIILNNIIL